MIHLRKLKKYLPKHRADRIKSILGYCISYSSSYGDAKLAVDRLLMTVPTELSSKEIKPIISKFMEIMYSHSVPAYIYNKRVKMAEKLADDATAIDIGNGYIMRYFVIELISNEIQKLRDIGETSTETRKWVDTPGGGAYDGTEYNFDSMTNDEIARALLSWWKPNIGLGCLYKQLVRNDIVVAEDFIRYLPIGESRLTQVMFGVGRDGE